MELQLGKLNLCMQIFNKGIWEIIWEFWFRMGSLWIKGSPEAIWKNVGAGSFHEREAVNLGNKIVSGYDNIHGDWDSKNHRIMEAESAYQANESNPLLNARIQIKAIWQVVVQQGAACRGNSITLPPWALKCAVCLQKLQVPNSLSREVDIFWLL